MRCYREASPSARLRSCWRRTLRHFEVHARCNKDDVMWHVWLFWEAITASHVCRYSVNYSNVLKHCAEGSVWHFKFPKVVQCKHIFYIVNGYRHSFVIRVVYWETVLSILIEIGLYLTDKEQKISRHSFLLRQLYTSIYSWISKFHKVMGQDNRFEKRWCNTFYFLPKFIWALNECKRKRIINIQYSCKVITQFLWTSVLPEIKLIDWLIDWYTYDLVFKSS